MASSFQSCPFKIFKALLISPMRATWSTHDILDLTIVIIFDEEYNFLQLMFLPPSWVQTFASLCSRTPSVYILTLMWGELLQMG